MLCCAATCCASQAQPCLALARLKLACTAIACHSTSTPQKTFTSVRSVRHLQRCHTAVRVLPPHPLAVKSCGLMAAMLTWQHVMLVGGLTSRLLPKVPLGQGYAWLPEDCRLKSLQVACRKGQRSSSRAFNSSCCETHSSWHSALQPANRQAINMNRRCFCYEWCGEPEQSSTVRCTTCRTFLLLRRFWSEVN